MIYNQIKGGSKQVDRMEPSLVVLAPYMDTGHSRLWYISYICMLQTCMHVMPCVADIVKLVN